MDSLIDKMLKKIMEAECSIKDCNEVQYMYLSLPMENGIMSVSYPFCYKHWMDIMYKRTEMITLRDGSIIKIR